MWSLWSLVPVWKCFWIAFWEKGKMFWDYSLEKSLEVFWKYLGIYFWKYFGIYFLNTLVSVLARTQQPTAQFFFFFFVPLHFISTEQALSLLLSLTRCSPSSVSLSSPPTGGLAGGEWCFLSPLLLYEFLAFLSFKSEWNIWFLERFLDEFGHDFYGVLMGRVCRTW